MHKATVSLLFTTALAGAGLLALAACGHSDGAGAASSDNVEMPAEEALSGVTNAPVPDTGASPAAASEADTSLQDAARAAQGAASDATGNAAPADAASN